MHKHPQTARIKELLQLMIPQLQGDVRADFLQKQLDQIDVAEDAVARAIVAAYAGMGSFADAVFPQKLKEQVDELYILAQQIAPNNPLEVVVKKKKRFFGLIKKDNR
jgi:hypothetical protein